ncbi:MAG: hypothetical protein QOH06_4175 [Acidobacteriota bacterium]|jgi:hypothetical protein|nr:hypothetical protein [Acidobacteriota bacterium]
MRSSSSILARLALGLFAVFLAVSLSQAAIATARSGLLLLHARGETSYEERLRAYGPDYIQAIEKIRRTIPRDGAYILISGVSEAEGAPYWVKYDLAPRRAVYLGELRSLQPVDRLRKRLPRAARWVVIAYDSYRPPVLIERFKFVQERKRREGA